MGLLNAAKFGADIREMQSYFDYAVFARDMEIEKHYEKSETGFLKSCFAIKSAFSKSSLFSQGRRRWREWRGGNSAVCKVHKV